MQTNFQLAEELFSEIKKSTQFQIIWKVQKLENFFGADFGFLSFGPDFSILDPITKDFGLIPTVYDREMILPTYMHWHSE